MAGSSPGLCMAVQVLGSGSGHFPTCLHVLSGFEDGSLAGWDLRQPGQPLALERGHQEPVLCLAISPQAATAVTGSAGDQLCWWAGGDSQDGGTGALAESSIPGSSAFLHKRSESHLSHSGVADLVFRADGRVLAAAGWDGKVGHASDA
jgi:WD40 repeat protein